MNIPLRPSERQGTPQRHGESCDGVASVYISSSSALRTLAAVAIPK